jgi:hypothetical protein
MMQKVVYKYTVLWVGDLMMPQNCNVFCIRNVVLVAKSLGFASQTQLPN